MRKERILTARAIEGAIKSGKAQKIYDGGGLILGLKAGRCSWAYCYTWQARGRQMGLGAYPAVSLAEARELRDKWRRVLLVEGRDPIEARGESSRPAPDRKTFGQVAEELIRAKAPEWRHPKTEHQWRRSLEVHVAGLRSIPIDAITTDDILAVLRKHWERAPVVAQGVRSCIELVLDAARARGYIDKDAQNPARWKGHIEHWLTKRSRGEKKHHDRMKWKDVPGFVARVRELQATGTSMAAYALEFCILTACRTNEVLTARWDEVDLEARKWTIPASRMKVGKEHEVPLSDRAIEIIETLSEARSNEFLFPGQIRGRSLAGNAMRKVMGRLCIEGATVHGFRSSFRDWCGDATSVSREIAEAALAHTAGGVEGAYRRGSAFDKRRELMAAWAEYLDGAGASNNVVALRR
jgi:integrase